MDRIRTLLLARTHIVVMDPDLVASAATRPARDVDVDRFEAELTGLGYVLSLDLASTLRRLPHPVLQELRGWIRETLVRPARPTGVIAQHQPCPWCGKTTTVHALDPCGHLVCKTCWESTRFVGCPICHRRVALGAPIERPPLTLVHLGVDLPAMARARFERLLARTTPPSPDDRHELMEVIDDLGPRAAGWLPATIPVAETRAAVIARLWLVAPDRHAMARDTQRYLETATDVLRVAIVLMGGDAALTKTATLRSIPRSLRRAVLEALDRIPIDQIEEDVAHHVGLWKRAGERLHPGELATNLPNAARAFAIVRGAVARPPRWAGPIEAALRAGNPRSALVRLTHRPDELLRRADHLVRLAQARQLDALQTLVKAVEIAAPRGAPATLLTLASHVARRGRPWQGRVIFPDRDVLRSWTMPDRRPPLRADAIGSMVTSLRRELVRRAEHCRHFPRAVIDRALVDVPVPSGPRTGWPRGSELPLPAGLEVRLAAHGVERCAIEMFDADWRYVATCDGAIHLETAQARGARHLVMVVSGATAGAYVTVAAPDADASARRFELHGRAMLRVPLVVDLDDRALRWLDIHVRNRSELDHAGGYHAALAHVARDLTDLADTRARPTMWDVACIHAAARATTVYVRERDGAFTAYRRRDGETALARLGRLLSGVNDDGKLATLPSTVAPTWTARLDEIMQGSAWELVAELAPRR